ncbi:unnamed protein product, partial [Onchocerca ochengi]|uniref:Uncharacterized protein n=1 Tax=Onchocerca ochengi TaxID=42157 RepID=A0A182EZ16_ONCOC
MIANLPPSSTNLFLYKGYSSFPVTVLDTNARGYCLELFRLSCMVNLDSVYRK